MSTDEKTKISHSTIDREKLEALLSKVRVFANLSKNKMEAVLKRLQALQFPANRQILEDGKPIKFMFIVGDGSIEVRKKDPKTGISFLLRTLNAGDNFGEMALLTAKPYTASLMTTKPTILFVLNQDNFRSLLIEEPEISLTLSQLLAEQLMSAYDQVGIQSFDLNNFHVESEILNLLPKQLIIMHKAIPIVRRGNALTIAMVEPANIVAHDDVKRHIRDVILEPVLITEADFVSFVEKIFPGALAVNAQKARRTSATNQAQQNNAGGGVLNQSPSSDMSFATNSAVFNNSSLMSDEEDFLATPDKSEPEEKATLADLEQAGSSGPVVKLANNVLIHALKAGASDIHLEPQSQGLVIRFRVDGNLKVIQVLPSKLVTPLVSRFKILSNLDITEKRIPQDGRISSSFQGRRIDFRLSTVPAKYGEKIVLRILDNSLSNISLETLISHKETYDRFRDLIDKPHGIIFVTGPTGSGKTTTLYSALGEINTPDINISTAEDPIEYDLAGINQVQVQRAVGVDFATILRAFLRQDPDVILVGETRDKETAKTAIEAALTGHLVFTTLHTNSAADSFARLEEMGVEPFMVGAATVGVVAQRLARRLCSACKVPSNPDRELLNYLGFAPDEGASMMKAGGCPKCSGSGFKGRVGVYELLIVDDKIRPLVIKKRTPSEIESSAVEAGMMTLANYGKWLIREGLTTLEEVLRVISFE